MKLWLLRSLMDLAWSHRGLRMERDELERRVAELRAEVSALRLELVEARRVGAALGTIARQRVRPS